MESLRQALGKLGWPVSILSDEDIARELYRRWFAHQGIEAAPAERPNLATANGVFVAMARNGNLDDLCWSREDDEAFLDAIPLDDVDPLNGRTVCGDADPSPRQPERRASRRSPESSLIGFITPSSPDRSCGWLVDVSSTGIAFMAETKDVPALGTRITSTVHGQNGEVRTLESATVVRTELLNEMLSLVCAEIDPDYE